MATVAPQLSSPPPSTHHYCSIPTTLSMLDYEWGSPSPVMMDVVEETAHGSEQGRQHMFDNYGESFNDGMVHSDSLFSHHHEFQHQQQHQQQTDPTLHYFYDPQAQYGASSYTQPHPQPSFLRLETAASGGRAGFMLVPKSEEMSVPSPVDFTARLGLNLGGRTYFSAADDDFMTRLYRRSRPVDISSAANSPRCQAEGCNADLTHAKHYHRRHKVCEYHSKASTVVAAGLTQRFCQQCSRFHLLSEFDNGKRSCRKRLADHNRRRRKSNQLTTTATIPPVIQDQHDGFTSKTIGVKNAPLSNTAEPAGSPPVPSSSLGGSSPPRMTLDCFRGRTPHVESPQFFSSGC